MALAIIGGQPERFALFAQIHRQASEEAGHGRLPLGINSHGFIADTSEEAAELAYPPFKTMMDRIGKERGWPPMSREEYDASRSLHGANFIGSPQEVIDKILFQHEVFDHDRFLIQFTVGSIPHAKVMRSIELLGTEVAPAVRKELGSAGADAAAAAAPAAR